MADQRKARLAFIGCGGFATHSLCPNIPFIPEIDLVAVCDIVQARADANARNFGARRAYTDLEEMLDRETPDGVFVIGPAPQQYELAPHVLRRGIPVYVEKPSANTSAEARELAELAEQHGTWGQCGFMKRFSYLYTFAKEVMARPEFGPVNMVSIKFGQGPYPQIWGIDAAKRAFLIGQCCHLFDLCRFMGGDVVSLTSLFHQVEETRFAYLTNLTYASGAVGHINLNCYENYAGFRDIQERCEVWSNDQSIVCEDMRTLRYLPREDWLKSVPGTGPYPMSYEPSWTGFANSRQAHGYHGEVQHFARRCLGLVEGGPDLWDSYESLRLGEAVYQSAHGAGTVAIPAR
ncbi:MAG: Gfo/Idh/MocA family oxidoreductase [Armatimonadetes bacterium]|nr:Gfo/Idh/MocA family oxidoreductase [Armatimonadota bacterium]